jgi:Tol biopolymer transport system component
VRTLVLLALLAIAVTVPAGAQAAFPGANGAIALSHGVEGVFGVAAISPPDTATRGLIAGAEAPAFSPDGRWIVYAVPPSEDRRGGLRLARADGTRRRVLTRNALGSDRAPAWSPDGRRIVFHRYVSGEGSFESTIYMIRRDGSHRCRIARGLFPAWSSHGRIAFARQVSATAPFTDGIYTMRPNGSRLRRLTRDARDSAPNWSPHGLNLVFARAGGVARVRADGTSVELLARRGMEPAWSPDGRQIVFSRGDALWAMRGNGAGPRRLTEPAVNQEFGAPDWQPVTAGS